MKRQTDQGADRPRGRQMKRQTNQGADRPRGIQTKGQTDQGADRPRGRQMKGQTDRQTEDEQRSEQTDKQTETDLRLLARGLRTSTGVPSSSVITMLLLDSARKCLLRRRKSSHVGVVGSYRKVT